MINKFFKYILKDIKTNYKFYIALLVIFLLFTVKFDYYIYSPGGLVELTDRIEVENSYDSKGTFNLTYVMARDGNIPNIILSYLIPSWDLVSLNNMRIDEESEKEILERDKIYLKETSYDAIIAAFDEAGIKYNIDNVSVVVTYVSKNSKTDLKVGDAIKSVNGVVINNFNDLKNEIVKYKENDKLTIKVLRDDKEKECYAELIKEDNQVVIGITLSDLKDVSTNPKVKYIFKDNESGSSRGLICALDIYNKITEYDLTKGKKISGTGVIYQDGSVGAIDGVKYKLKGAVNKKAQVFIVPSANYEEALKEKKEHNYNIEIIEADNLHNVIKKLKELK